MFNTICFTRHITVYSVYSYTAIYITSTVVTIYMICYLYDSHVYIDYLYIYNTLIIKNNIC